MRRILWLSLCLAGCPGKLDDPGLFTGTSPDYCQSLTEFTFKDSCARSQCHSAAVAEAELDLETEPVGPRLVGKSADDPDCDGVMIDPAAPEESILYKKMTSRPPCGQQMPLFLPAVKQVQLDCMLEWIAGQEAK